MAIDDPEDNGPGIAGSVDEEKITSPPAPVTRPDPMAAARPARAKKDRDRLQAKAEEYRTLYPTLAHLGDSTQLMMRKMGVSKAYLRKIESYCSLRLQDARRAAKLAATADGKPIDAPPTRPTHLKWTILQLFDTLMAYFRVADGDDEQPTNDNERDLRSTWTAWRVFLAAAFGCLQLDLIADHRMDGNSDTGTSPTSRGVGFLKPGQYMPEYPGVSTSVDIPRGAAALTPSASHQAIFEACTGRKTWPTWQSRIVSLIVGRRGGKSYITAIIGIYLALCRRYTLNLGTKGMVMILARDREQASVIRSYVVAFLKTPPLIGFLKDEPTQRLIELNNGITIEIRSVSEAGTRGYTVVAALMDEIAFWPTDANSAKQDKKVLRALRPAMLGIKNAMIVMLSSPYAQRGELYDNYKRSYGKDDDKRHLVWQADTLSMRPSDDEDLLDEIRAEYDEDPENAKAEYGALFRSDIQGLFNKRVVEAVCIPGRAQLAYQPDRTPYRGFVDPSGGSSDSYVLAIAHEESREIGGEFVQVPVLDLVREWQAPFSPEDVSREVVDACKPFGLTEVTGDAYGGEWPREPLQKKGLQYTLAEKTRSELYLEFLPMVNSGRCELLDSDAHKRMVNQLANLERRMGRTGKDTVDHPPGAHDDVANAVAGVMVASSEVVLFDGVVW